MPTFPVLFLLPGTAGKCLPSEATKLILCRIHGGNKKYPVRKCILRTSINTLYFNRPSSATVLGDYISNRLRGRLGGRGAYFCIHRLQILFVQNFYFLMCVRKRKKLQGWPGQMCLQLWNLFFLHNRSNWCRTFQEKKKERKRNSGRLHFTKPEREVGGFRDGVWLRSTSKFIF